MWSGAYRSTSQYLPHSGHWKEHDGVGSARSVETTQKPGRRPAAKQPLPQFSKWCGSVAEAVFETSRLQAISRCWSSFIRLGSGDGTGAEEIARISHVLTGRFGLASVVVSGSSIENLGALTSGTSYFEDSLPIISSVRAWTQRQQRILADEERAAPATAQLL